MDPEPTIDYANESCWWERVKTLGFKEGKLVDRLFSNNPLAPIEESVRPCLFAEYRGWSIRLAWAATNTHVEVWLRPLSENSMEFSSAFAEPQDVYKRVGLLLQRLENRPPLEPQFKEVCSLNQQ